MTRTDSRTGVAALILAHCAGMLDVVSLPVWVGTLISRYGFDEPLAGALVTLFLASMLVASVLLAPRFGRVRGRTVASVGFAISALGFFYGATRSSFADLALMHGVCGLATGAALSVTHGTIARSARPHRLFAIVNGSLGVAAVFYLGIAPQVIAAVGAAALFVMFGSVMALAAVVSLLAFPALDEAPSAAPGAAPAARGFQPAVWFGIAGIACLSVVQAMVFSFVERIGADRGFTAAAVTGVLVALGLVNLLAAPLAGLLEKRLDPRRVLMVAPLVQATLALALSHTSTYAVYVLTASVFVAVVIFAHTFAFGLLARLEPSGRALSATPAMMMTGAAIGPLLGGLLVSQFGYGALGYVALAIAALGAFSFSHLPSAAVPTGVASRAA